ncbi:MAG: mechanosensitive ion channel [Magnetococcales bacterium]|nr:mechanosensitive ion channel [Magnetococcales bacterium]
MDGLTLIVATLGGMLSLFLLATVLTWPLRSRGRARRAGNDPPLLAQPDAGSGENTSWLGILLDYISRPLVVLLLTELVAGVLRENPGLVAGWSLDERYLKAWYLFWLALLFFNGNEALGRLFYTVRKRHFPVPGLVLFLLRLLLIGGATLSILHFVLDFDTSKLLTSTAVVAAVVGIALREVLSNFLAGVSMNLVGTVEPAQWIAVGDKEGEIIQRNWRETRLRTTGGHVLIIPNGTLANSVIHNLTWPTPLRRHQMTVTLAFNASPQQVREALVEAALSVVEVDRGKGPDAHLHDYRDYGVVYQLRYWSRTYFDRTRLEGAVRERIWYQLRRRGLEIPFPQGGDLSVATAVTQRADGEDPLARNTRLLLACGFLERVVGHSVQRPILAPDELKRLIADLNYRVFGPGEALFRQGESGRVCYLLVTGRLQGQTRYEGMSMTQEFAIGAGELVGEIALMTGLPRSSTVWAVDGEAELLEFSQGAFDRFLDNPVVSEAVSTLVARRSRHLFEDLCNLEPGQPEAFHHPLQQPSGSDNRGTPLAFFRWWRKPGREMARPTVTKSKN